MGGRRPLPAKIKQARGDAGKRGVRPNPQAPPGIPDPPESVKARPLALAEWNRIGAILQEMHVLTVVDRVAMRDMAVSYAESERLLAALAQPQLRDAKYKDISIRLLNWMKLGQIAGEKLGLNPAARGRLYSSPDAQDPSEKLAADFGLT